MFYCETHLWNKVRVMLMNEERGWDEDDKLKEREGWVKVEKVIEKEGCVEDEKTKEKEGWEEDEKAKMTKIERCGEGWVEDEMGKRDEGSGSLSGSRSHACRLATTTKPRFFLIVMNTIEDSISQKCAQTFSTVTNLRKHQTRTYMSNEMPHITFKPM